MLVFLLYPLNPSWSKFIRQQKNGIRKDAVLGYLKAAEISLYKLTLIAGLMVEQTEIFKIYLPLAAAGLALATASRSAS